MTTEKQRIYFVGTGIIADTHCEALDSLTKPYELHVADLSEKARQTFGEKQPDATLYASSDEMFEAPAREDDIVLILTPPAFHHSETLKALRSGRHVLCEKPFAMNLEEATEMVEEAERLGLQIGCCSARPYAWPVNEKIKQMLDDKAIGRVFHVEWVDRDSRLRRGLDGRSHGVWWSLDKSKAAGGRLVDLAPYDVAVWMQIFDPVKVTISNVAIEQINLPADYPEGLIYDVETHVSGNVELLQRDGNRIQIHFERADSTHGVEAKRHMIHGTDGCLDWDMWGWVDRQTRHYHLNEAGESICTTTEEPPGINAYNNFVMNPFPQFVKHVAGKETVSITGKTALNYFAIIQAFYESSETGSPVSIEL